MPVMDGEYYRPTYKVPTYRPPTTYKKTYTPQYREEPYDNSGAMRAAEQARLIREAQVRQAQQEAAQRQAQIDELNRIAAENLKKATITKNISPSQQDWMNMSNPMSPTYGIPPVTQKTQTNYAYLNTLNPFATPVPTPRNRQAYIPSYAETINPFSPYYRNPNMPLPSANNFLNYNMNPVYGYGEDWGMMQSGAIANRFGGGQLDRANWGRGVPSWDEVLRYADPNAHDPYDVAGNPYFTAEDMPIEDYYGGGYGGYGGGGSYSSKPGYYGQSSNYGNRYYENLLQWNI